MSAPTPPRPARGFTAVEMTMVVTVIAILALLILPLFQRQSDEARTTAAQGDIREFGIAMQLANAHTGFFFPLSALDNSDVAATPVDPTTDVPVSTWNDGLTIAERNAMAEQWEGPYASFQRTSDAQDLPTFWFRGGNNITTAGVGDNGPINLQVDAAFAGLDTSRERIPLDPWGNPYLFYGPDYYHLPNGTGGLVNPETRFRNFLIVSFGPNGVPGDFAGATFGALELARESGIVADRDSDDIFRLF